MTCLVSKSTHCRDEGSKTRIVTPPRLTDFTSPSGLKEYGEAKDYPKIRAQHFTSCENMIMPEASSTIIQITGRKPLLRSSGRKMTNGEKEMT
jgi:hypothetical protein